MFLRCTHFFVCLEHFFNICVPYLWALCSESVWVKNAQRGKCPNTEFFRSEYRKYESIPTSIFQCNGHSVKSVQIRSFFWSVFPLFSPNTEKHRPEKTPYLDTFYAVIWSRSLIKFVGFFLLSVILSLIWSNFIICDCSLFVCIFNSIVDCVSAVLYCLPTIFFDSAFVIFTEFSQFLSG